MQLHSTFSLKKKSQSIYLKEIILWPVFSFFICFANCKLPTCFVLPIANGKLFFANCKLQTADCFFNAEERRHRVVPDWQQVFLPDRC